MNEEDHQMKEILSNSGLLPLEVQEAAYVIGGTDKKAQDALYTIGYIIGVIVKFIGSLFIFNGEKRAAKKAVE